MVNTIALSVYSITKHNGRDPLEIYGKGDKKRLEQRLKIAGLRTHVLTIPAFFPAAVMEV